MNRIAVEIFFGLQRPGKRVPLSDAGISCFRQDGGIPQRARCRMKFCSAPFFDYNSAKKAAAVRLFASPARIWSASGEHKFLLQGGQCILTVGAGD